MVNEVYYEDEVNFQESHCMGHRIVYRAFAHARVRQVASAK